MGYSASLVSGSGVASAVAVASSAIAVKVATTSSEIAVMVAACGFVDGGCGGHGLLCGYSVDEGDVEVECGVGRDAWW